MSELISRQAVLNTLDNMDKALDEERTVENYKELLTECIKVLPSVQPIKHKEEWIPIKNKNGTVIALKCPYCEKSPKYAIRSDFCPNCGADMRGEPDEKT